MSIDPDAREAIHHIGVVLFVQTQGGTQEQAVRLDQVVREDLSVPRTLVEMWDILDRSWTQVLAEEPQVDTKESPAERLRWLASQLPGSGASWWEREDMVDVVPMVAEIIGDHFHGNAESAPQEARWIIEASPKTVLGLLDEFDTLQAQVEAIKKASWEVKSCGGKHSDSDSEGCHVRDLVLGVRQITSPSE